MSDKALLILAFTDFWISGTGASRGREADAIPARDKTGFPIMPMSQVKGQLRETADRLAERGVGGWSVAKVQRLFGEGGDKEAALAFVGEAALDWKTRSLLAGDAGRITRFYRTLSATKIDENGVADDYTLREVETVVPVTLFGIVNWKEGTPDPDWVNLVDHARAATLAFGKLKSDGYGRAIASLEPLK